MTWEQIQGKWTELKGSIRHKFGQLSDSDVEQIAGNREKLVGRLQQRYGYTREKAEREITDWLSTVSQAETSAKVRTGGGSH